MNKEDILHFIQKGENETLEFKSSFNKSVIESIVAFSNTEGGSIIIGVSDKKEIIGTSVKDETIQKWLNEIKQNTIPQVIPNVKIQSINNKIIVLFEISEYPVKPVSFKNKYFKRVLNSNHLMSLDEISNEHLKTINNSWDFYPDPNHNVNHISLEKAEKFIHNIEKRTKLKIDLSTIDFLSRLEIIRNNSLTFGAYLLFAKDYCSISEIQVGRFKSEITIIDSITIETDLFTEVNDIISFIKKHLMIEYIITGEPQRTERYDYPLEAIRELVINMIVHRDYRDSSDSIIKIFDDRIEFFNPGKLYGNITINDLLSNNYTSQVRNKLIAKAFKEIGLIERYGSGIKRILNICKNYGVVPPKFEEISNGFKVSLFKEKLLNKKSVVDDVVDDVVDRRLNQIINLINKNNQITANQIAEMLNITSRTAQRDLEKLKRLNIIKRIGSAKSGYWKIINELESR